jgi:pectate lyase-like protein/List-Bact-rpt repeat protein/type IX secretion system substrate protein
MKEGMMERNRCCSGSMAALTVAVLCLMFVSVCAATQIYVSPAGSDSAAGTFAQPFRTIPHAVSVAVAGDTIYVRGGTHVYSTTISISKSGTAPNRYYLFAYPGERPLLDFSSMPFSSSNRGIRLSGSYWYIKGLDIKGAGDNGMNLSGSNNTIEFCSFFENQDTGLQLGGGASNNQIINCDAYYNKDPSQGNADGFAPKLDVGTGNYFYGCRSWQNSDDGWDGYLRPSDDITTTYENCWCFKNGYLKDGTPSTGNGNGFKLGGSDLKNLRHNFILRNCVSFDNRVKGFDQNNNVGSITLYNCTAYNNGTNYKIDAPLDSGKTLTVINCDVLGPYGSLGSFAIQQTNSWLPGFTVTSADFQSIDPSGATAPRKPDGSLPDVTFMHLAPGSGLIDAGTDIGLPFNGSAPDLGAFETPDSALYYTLTIGVVGNGLVVKNPDQASYLYGSSVQLTAEPASGWALSGWSGDTTGTVNPLTVPIYGNRNITATFVQQADSGLIFVRQGWNMISLPLRVADSRKNTLFPSAASPAFSYNASYVAEESLRIMAGYWLKFPAPDTVEVTGTHLDPDTLAVDTGWNLIGSISNPVAVAAIATVPPGLVTSRFFGYADGYFTSDTIKPGSAYWVKVSQAGSLVLSGTLPASSAKNRIRIVAGNENPPPAPGAGMESRRSATPVDYALEQNWPNPFNPATVVAFSTPRAGHVTLRIYDMLGREVAILVDEEKRAGDYTVLWNASEQPSGVYIVRMASGSFSATRKIVLMK